jgi:hypothetical protein
MNKNIILLIAITIFPILTFSQTIIPKLDWYKIYDGPGNSVDLTNDIKMDINKNIYLSGRSVGLDGADLLILKYSEFGDSLLELKFDSAPQSWDEAFSIAIDSDFNIYVIGSSTFEQNTFYAIFHKYSLNGELLWAKNFNQDINVNSEGVQVVLNSKEEAIIGYNRISAKIGKYSSAGDSLWTISIEDDTSSYQVNYITTDKNDNIYASILQLYWDGGDLPATKVLILKISDSGEILWVKIFDSNGGRKIILDKDENPILLAADTKIIKFNPIGDTLWTKEYPYVGDIIITTNLIVDSKNNILFTGYGLGNDSWDYFTYKLTSSGEELWTRIFNSDEQLNDYAYGLAIDKDDNIYVTGGTHNSISVGYCYTIKYSSEGELKWKHKFDAPHSKFENGNEIFVDDSNNVFVGGDVADSINGWNFLAFKIKQDFTTGIENTDNPNTKINFSIPESDNIKIEIYDILGRFISELFHGYITAGNHSKDFNTSNLSSGIYYYRLSTSKNSLMKKAVLIK